MFCFPLFPFLLRLIIIYNYEAKTKSCFMNPYEYFMYIYIIHCNVHITSNVMTCHLLIPNGDRPDSTWSCRFYWEHSNRQFPNFSSLKCVLPLQISYTFHFVRVNPSENSLIKSLASFIGANFIFKN